MPRAILSGDTRPIKETLKRQGWKWDGQCWSRLISDAQADACRDAVGREAQREAAERFFANKKGCVLTINGIVRYTSPSYVPPAVTGADSEADPDGMGWNADGYGNPVSAPRIPGSAPDDRI
jgi:transposase InsO family protein